MQMILALLLVASPASLTEARLQRSSSPVDALNDCPFGYGTNCRQAEPLDPATKAQVADILSGILKNLQGHKALAQTAQKVQKVSPSPTVAHAMQSLLST